MRFVLYLCCRNLFKFLKDFDEEDELFGFGKKNHPVKYTRLTYIKAGVWKISAIMSEACIQDVKTEINSNHELSLFYKQVGNLSKRLYLVMLSLQHVCLFFIGEELSFICLCFSV